jgi:phosphate starvation-inducible PhoH-like protein
MNILYLLLSGFISGLKTSPSKALGLTTRIFNPKTENQKNYVKYLQLDKDYIISVIGPAGTGKTLFACNAAIDCLKKKTINKIVITRPAISVEEELGFLPGNLEKKMAPWTRPLFDIFLDSFSKTDLNNMINNNIIEISPLGFMRGRTFKDSFIIADEMQNSSPNQMLMLLTRIGANSKMVITGDLEQSDRMENNGLKDFITRLKCKTSENFYLVEMEEKDVQRSHLVNEVLQLYNIDLKKQVSSPSNLTIVSDGNTTSSSTSKNYSKLKPIENDAAMIPLSQITGNYKP